MGVGGAFGVEKKLFPAFCGKAGGKVGKAG